jgi:hypothetical protein
MAWLWFKFPDGMSEISVELHNYRAEVVDPVDSLGCFRAPDHYTALILDGSGIRLMPAPPKGAPTNDPEPPDGVEDPNAILLGGQINSLKLQVAGLEANLVELGHAYETQKGHLLEANAKLSQFAEADPALAQELGMKVDPVKKK